jgi:hypothetical protein
MADETIPKVILKTASAPDNDDDADDENTNKNNDNDNNGNDTDTSDYVDKSYHRIKQGEVLLCHKKDLLRLLVRLKRFATEP